MHNKRFFNCTWFTKRLKSIRNIIPNKLGNETVIKTVTTQHFLGTLQAKSKRSRLNYLCLAQEKKAPFSRLNMIK